MGVEGWKRRRRRDGPDSIARNLNKSIFSPLKAAIFQSDGCCKHHSSAQHYETRRSTFRLLLFSFLEKGGKMPEIYCPFVGFYFCGGAACRLMVDVAYCAEFIRTQMYFFFFWWWRGVTGVSPSSFNSVPCNRAKTCWLAESDISKNADLSRASIL